MGAWGPAIFSDDTACDVRDSYRERISDGKDGTAATTEMLEQWKIDSLAADDDDVLVFWLALAATQWKVGRLEDRVRNKAIEVIDSGKDLGRWKEVGQVDKRAAVLRKLKEQLLSPQPAPKNVRVEKPQVPPWSCGDYVSYRLNSGDLVILYVQGVFGQSLWVSLLDWVGSDPPDNDTILGLSKRVPVRSHRTSEFGLYTMKKRGIPFARLSLLEVKHPNPKPHPGTGLIFDWGEMDYHLKDSWGLE